MKREPTVCLVACDVSADQNAARLATAIRAAAPQARVVGIGGRHQAAAGVEVMLHTTHLSFTGVLGSLGRLPSLVQHYRRAAKLVEQSRPDVAVIVDAEMVGCPFAARLRRAGIPVVLFFPPHVWFWGAWRARLVASIATRVVSAFRQEAEIYRQAGVDTVWVGHPLRDAVASHTDRATALRGIGLDPERPLVVLMPGSRHNEIAQLTAPFLDAAQILHQRDPRMQFALPVANQSLRAEIDQRARACRLGELTLYEPASYDVLACADLVLQSSGTATLETALLGIPSVIAYRCIPVEYAVARLMMRVPFIGLPNILLGEMVQPEFFQHIDAPHLAQAAWGLLSDEGRRRAVRSRLALLPELLGPTGVLERTATAVLDLLPGEVVARTSGIRSPLRSVA